MTPSSLCSSFHPGGNFSNVWSPCDYTKLSDLLLFFFVFQPPDEYRLIWITSDLISFIIIVGVFIFQK